ncbi:nickel/cobalt transporter [Shimwellia pseudoproteus]|uniref:nickel/cobalt transporter n=1 Tax=Shimwellia pseudoproteus TaxID=570012 RepID=UPI0018EE2DEB|nr:nickel/cobalt transporter [Shimwellia pseudoproteus]MBJ3815686.1 nickel/cobalt transporter [Shimwellia pseudoproteus]
MSVIIPPARRGQQRHWLAFWPLAGALVLMAGGGLLLWYYWPVVLLESATWQRSINLQLSQLLRDVAAEPLVAGGPLLLFSFVYGVLHALGPGHGKVVITTWLATHPARLGESLRLTFAASLLQGLVAIGLVTLVLTLLQLPARQLHLSGYWLEKGSYLLVGVLGAMLCWRALRRLRLLLRRSPRFRRFTLTQPHVHSATCGCGHHHVPAADALDSATDWRSKAMLVAAMGMRPCSGAIMVLLFSKVIGIFSWGMAAALAMSAGTSLTISGFAVLVHSFRWAAQRLANQHTPPLWRQVMWPALAMAGGMVLMVAAFIMWQGAMMPARGLRPF